MIAIIDRLGWILAGSTVVLCKRRDAITARIVELA
jgi:hypothetical protein